MTRRLTLLASLGALGLIMLLWRIDLNAVKLSLLHVGWGMALVLGQEIVAHVLNAWGWRFAFTREAAGRFPLAELIRLRVAGDAINYLTPTATIGGEIARTALLSDACGVETRAVSVIIAKTSQTLAQGFFVAAGLGLVAAEWITWGRWFVVWVGVGLLAVTLVAFRLKPRLGGMATAWWRALGPKLTAFIRHHPGRVALSILMFTAAYAWGAFEVYWICRFLGTPVVLGTALTIEILSITIDGLFFMVPAKIGTQESGKVVVFAAVGLSPSLGLAFGIVRHVRELVWACAGVLLYGATIRRDSLSSLGRVLARTAAPTRSGE